jgi:hypothetical protein
MLSQYFSNIEGIATYPMIALLIFFPFFVAITAYIRSEEHTSELQSP